MKANVAREDSKIYEFNNIIQDIKAAIHMGKVHIEVSEINHSRTYERLTELGYEIEERNNKGMPIKIKW